MKARIARVIQMPFTSVKIMRRKPEKYREKIGIFRGEENSHQLFEMKKRGIEGSSEPFHKQRKIEPSHPLPASSITSQAPAEVIEKLIIPEDKPGVIRVLDRRINSFCFNESSSLYSLLRAWVQDDPDKAPSLEVFLLSSLS